MIRPHCTQDVDLFCRVIDHYGDAGFAWRLACQLSEDWGHRVRLFVDELSTLYLLAGCRAPVQRGITVIPWHDAQWCPPAPHVVSLFHCEPPDDYVHAMAKESVLWVAMDYLATETWAVACHLQPSLHRVPKYFYFPGAKTGGLLRERHYWMRQQHFCVAQQSAFLAQQGVLCDQAMRIFFFAYACPSSAQFLDVLAHGSQPIRCIIFEALFAQLHALLPSPLIQESARCYRCHRLMIHVVPFVPQHQFDWWLWSVDLSIVRGEDSFSRAQLAGKPFLWQPYVQQDDAHWPKLYAFLQSWHACQLYCPERLFIAFSSGNALLQAQAWQQSCARWSEWQKGAACWRDQMAAQPDLLAQLHDFWYQYQIK